MRAVAQSESTNIAQAIKALSSRDHVQYGAASSHHRSFYEYFPIYKGAGPLLEHEGAHVSSKRFFSHFSYISALYNSLFFQDYSLFDLCSTMFGYIPMSRLSGSKKKTNEVLVLDNL